VARNNRVFAAMMDVLLHNVPAWMLRYNNGGLPFSLDEVTRKISEESDFFDPFHSFLPWYKL
jgi:hypothetical protein